MKTEDIEYLLTNTLEPAPEPEIKDNIDRIIIKKIIKLFI